VNNVITNLDTKNFETNWKLYLEAHAHSLIYTLDYIEYYNSYCKNIVHDFSFIITRDHKPVGICFLPVENVENVKSISLNNGYIPAPLFKDKKTEKIIFEYIHNICKDNKISQVKLSSDPNLEFNLPNKFNLFKQYNYLETNSLNATIDLLQNKEELWKNLSKSFKSLINKYTKNTKHTLHIMNQSNADISIIKSFWKLHCDIAGEYAREFDLFNAQFKLIEKGYASLYFIKDNEEIISYSLFFHYNNFVTYVSSVSKDIEDKPPLSHFILWNATVNFKDLGNTLIQYGQPSSYSLFSGIDDMSSQKELLIASFKRNMGAQITTLYRGIKYFDKQLLEQKLLNFLEMWDLDEK